MAAHNDRVKEIARHCKNVDARHRDDARKTQMIFMEKVKLNLEKARKKMALCKEKHDTIVRAQKTRTLNMLGNRKSPMTGHVPVPLRPGHR